MPVREGFVDEPEEEGDIVERGVGGAPASCHAAAEGHSLDGLPRQELVCHPPQGAAAAVISDAAPQLLTREQRLPGQRQAPLLRAGGAGRGSSAVVGSIMKMQMQMQMQLRLLVALVLYMINSSCPDWCGRNAGQLPRRTGGGGEGQGGGGEGLGAAGQGGRLWPAAAAVAAAAAAGTTVWLILNAVPAMRRMGVTWSKGLHKKGMAAQG